MQGVLRGLRAEPFGRLQPRAYAPGPGHPCTGRLRAWWGRAPRRRVQRVHGAYRSTPRGPGAPAHTPGHCTWCHPPATRGMAHSRLRAPGSPRHVPLEHRSSIAPSPWWGKVGMGGAEAGTAPERHAWPHHHPCPPPLRGRESARTGSPNDYLTDVLDVGVHGCRTTRSAGRDEMPTAA